MEMCGDEKNGNTEHSSSSQNVKKRSLQYSKMCFTFNNYTENNIVEMISTFRTICKKYVFQKEIGSQGTPHLQGAIWLHKRMRFTEFGLPSSIHWEKMRNEEASIAYCKKSDTSVGEPYIYGFPKPIRIIDSLYKWQKSIEDIYLQEPDDRSIYWFWDEEGNIGKSSFVKYMVVKYGACFCDGGKKSDLINLIFNTNMDECKCIIWDIPRASKGHVSYSTLESIKNGLVCNTKYETGVKAFNAPHIFCFANFPPEEPEKLSQDRWRIYNIDGGILLL